MLMTSNVVQEQAVFGIANILYPIVFKQLAFALHNAENPNFT